MNRTPVPEEFQDAELATRPQVQYLEALRDGKDTSPLSDDQRAWLARADFSTIKKSRASDVIGQLKELPWKPRESATKQNENNPVVPNGRYAVEKDDGTLMFYSVKIGRYTTFVDVWASDTRWPIKANDEKLRILQLIAVDPKAAAERFGQEIGACAICGRTLTDETSRAIGIGPVCRGRSEWYA